MSEVRQVTGDAYASRRESARKWEQGIWLIAGILEVLLAFRLVFALLAANRSADFSAFIFAVTRPFVEPFVGLFGTPVANGSVLEPHTVLAMIVYALVAWVLTAIAGLLLGDSRSSVTTTRYESHSDTDLRSPTL